MLVHLFEPHSTYMEHPGFTMYREHGPASLTEKYDYEIAFDDALIGELLDALDKTGLAKTTTVIVMSDHGEAFGVHPGEAGFFHGMSLYQRAAPRAADVPRARRQAARMRDDVVQLVDHGADDRRAVRRRAADDVGRPKPGARARGQAAAAAARVRRDAARAASGITRASR